MSPQPPVRNDQGVHRLVDAHVRRDPAAVAVRDARTGGQLTYGELWRRAGALADRLAHDEVGPGAVVVLDLDRCPELIVAMLGVARAGAAYLPLDRHAPEARTEDVVKRAAAPVGVTGREPGPGWPGPRWMTLPDVADPPRGDDVPVDAETPLYVNFTSGTSGRPKGVLIPHRAVRRLVTGAAYCPLGPADRVAQLANPAFDATTFEVWSTLCAGGRVVILPAPTDIGLDRWIDLLAAERIGTMFLTTSLFHMIAAERPYAFRSLDRLLVGGEQLSVGAARAVLREGPPRRLTNVYGPTETTTFATFFDCTLSGLAGRSLVPLGRPIQQTYLRVVDDSLRPVPRGESGELLIGGPGVALGYLGEPAQTAQRFLPVPGFSGPVYATGDIVRETSDGDLELVGRNDRQVKVRGFRVELDEIEQAIVGTGLVAAAVVEKLGGGPTAMLAAFVLPVADGATAGRISPIERVRARLVDRLPGYMVPARWFVLDRLPLRATGKVDRDALVARAAEAVTTAAVADGGPATVLDQVARIWSEVLGGTMIESGTDFLAAGGNSILAVQVAGRISGEFSIECEPADVLLADSLAGLVHRVERSLRARC